MTEHEAKRQEKSGALRALAGEAQACRRCDLWRGATQMVFGDGAPSAPVVLVGEQPGDREDVVGRPFVGPAGLLLDRALREAGVDRAKLYVTNAVKHFKNEPRGKRRLHKTPDSREIEICRWWLDQELAVLAPKLTMALGATAARALVGRATPVNRHRGADLVFRNGWRGRVTIHPSALLRMRDEAQRAAEYELFVRDLAALVRLVPEVGA